VQLLFILGIVFAIIAVTFAIQNNASVAVVFGIWQFESSLAVVLLLAIGLGALIAALVSTPTMIKAQWDRASLQRQISKLEDEKLSLASRVREVESRLPSITTDLPPPLEEKPYVGLKSLLTGSPAQNF
jgi:putative membrane protein